MKKILSKSKIIGLVVLLAAAFATYTILWLRSTAPLEFETTIVRINDTTFTVEVADTVAKQKQGLQRRDSLGERHGMLFVFERTFTPSFWMKNTLIPLDIIWIADGVVVGITENVQPEPGTPQYSLQSYEPNTAVDMVLELNAGESSLFHISTGDKVEVRDW